MKRILSIVLGAMIFGSVVVEAQSSISQAQSVFIYNFTRLVEWPSQSRSGDFVIAVYGQSDLYQELVTYTNNKLVGNQKISVERYNKLEDIKNCHILVLAANKSRDIEGVTKAIQGKNTLLISERSGMIASGSAIDFVLREDRLRFELKPANAQKHGLKLNSTLEQTASLIH